MADFTFNSNYHFVSGDIGAYPATRWPAGSPSGAPIGTATDEQTISGGSVTFTGLTAGTDYYVSDAAGSKYVRISVPSTALDSTTVDALAEDVQTALDTKPTATLSTDGTLAANSDSNVSSQKAVKTYVDAEATTRALIDTALAANQTNTWAIYKPWIERQCTLLETSVTSTRLIGTSTIAAGSTAAAAAAGSTFPIVTSELAITGLTTKVSLQATCITNATSHGTQTFTVHLYPVSSVAGAADSSTVNVGASAASVAFVNPSTSTVTTSTAADITIPATGQYVLALHNSATVATDAFVTIIACLRYRHV